MKKLHQKTVNMWKRHKGELKLDLTMNTCYYRTSINGEILCSSVDPRLAAHATTGYAGSEVWMVEL